MTLPPTPLFADDAFSLRRRQVEAIDAWHERRRQQEATAGSVDDSRELRIDRMRQADVLRREHSMIVQHCDVHLRSSGGPVWREGPRAVVVHRHAWRASQLADALQHRGVRVVAVLENGADAVGAAVVEQPELVILSEVLPMVSSVEVVRELHALAPHTTAVVLVEHRSSVRNLAAAGAALTLPHATSCWDAADETLALHALASR
jgi:CheY-like chemotaxis protein